MRKFVSVVPVLTRLSIATLTCLSLITCVGRTSGQVTATFDTDDRVNSLAFSPDGKSLVAACGRFIGLLQEPRPGKVVIWDTETQKIRQELVRHSDGVTCAVFSPDGQMLATSGYDGAIKLWSPAAAQDLPGFQSKIGPIMAIAFSPDGARLAAGGCRFNQDQVINEFAVWDVPSRKLLATIPAHRDAVSCVAFLPNNKSLLTGSEDGTVKLWSTDDFTELRTIGVHAGAVRGVAVSPDGNRASVAYGDFFSRENPKRPAGGVTLWSTRNWRESFKLSLSEVAFSVAFSPDGKLLAAAGTGQMVRLLDACGRERAVLGGYVESLRSVCFSPNGKVLAAGGGDGKVKLWRAPQQKP